jgi:hypothetical protein
MRNFNEMLGMFWGNKFNKNTQNSNTMLSKLEEDDFIVEKDMNEDSVPFDQVNFNQIEFSENPDVKEDTKQYESRNLF